MGYVVHTSRYGRVRKMTARVEEYIYSFWGKLGDIDYDFQLAEFFGDNLSEADDVLAYKEALAEDPEDA